VSRVAVTIGGRPYTLACDAGEEERIGALAGELDETVAKLHERLGDVGELRLAVMAGLTALDRLAEAEAANARLRARLAALERAHEEAVLSAEADDEPFVARIEAATAALDRLAGLFNRDTRSIEEGLGGHGRVRPVAVAGSAPARRPAGDDAAEGAGPDSGAEPRQTTGAPEEAGAHRQEPADAPEPGEGEAGMPGGASFTAR